MLAASDVVALLGYSLLVILGWRLARGRTWRRYPFLAGYVAFVALRSIVVITTLPWTYTDYFYNQVFWYGASAVATARFAIAWELLRQIFPKVHPLRPLNTRISLGLLLVCAFLYFRMGPEGNLFSDLERKLALTAALWVIVIVGSAMFFRMSIRRDLVLLAGGVGLYAAMTLVNFASFELFAGFTSAWSWIRQWSFSLLMSFLIAAVWNPPQSSQGGPAKVSEDAPARWRMQWNSVWSSIRTVLSR